MRAGINVCLGHDSIMDPWYPLGRGDMLAAARLAIHLCHMTGYEEIQRMFDTVTRNSARSFGIQDDYGLAPGRRADFIILDAPTVSEAIRLSPACRYVVRAGRILAQTRPAASGINWNGKFEPVDFRRSANGPS